MAFGDDCGKDVGVRSEGYVQGLFFDGIIFHGVERWTDIYHGEEHWMGF